MKPKVILFWTLFPFLALILLGFGLVCWVPFALNAIFEFLSNVLNWALNGFEDWCFDNEQRYRPPWRF